MDITKFLQSRFPEAEVSLDGENCNSKVLIISRQFEGLTTIKRHKLVLNVLKEHFKSGELHALSLNTKTPSEIS
tara:strand:+ start:4108 stop:4329 length:222 start_codon:yes stop_codon:yes gene_type:complete